MPAYPALDLFLIDFVSNGTGGLFQQHLYLCTLHLPRPLSLRPFAFSSLTDLHTISLCRHHAVAPPASPRPHTPTLTSSRALQLRRGRRRCFRQHHRQPRYAPRRSRRRLPEIPPLLPLQPEIAPRGRSARPARRAPRRPHDHPAPARACVVGDCDGRDTHGCRRLPDYHARRSVGARFRVGKDQLLRSTQLPPMWRIGSRRPARACL